MVTFAEVSAQIAAQWGLGPGLLAPTVYDKDLRYSTLYPHKLFCKMYDEMPIKPISQSGGAGLTLRKQIFTIQGVFDSYTNADITMQEIKRIVTEKAGWYIQGVAKISQTRKRFVFLLPCYEKAYLQKGEW